MCPHVYQELCLSDEMLLCSLVVSGKETTEKPAIDEQCVLKVAEKSMNHFHIQLSHFLLMILNSLSAM